VIADEDGRRTYETDALTAYGGYRWRSCCRPRRKRSHVRSPIATSMASRWWREVPAPHFREERCLPRTLW